MKRVILVNAIVTGIGLILDTFGVLDSSFMVAVFGFIWGLIDLFTFFWMLSEIRDWIKQKRNGKRE